MKFWIQSFLLGVPKIIVGFRTRDGVLVDVKEIETHNIPQTVNSRQGARWNADMCVNFAGEFLECKPMSCSSRRMVPAPPSLPHLVNLVLSCLLRTLVRRCFPHDKMIIHCSHENSLTAPESNHSSSKHNQRRGRLAHTPPPGLPHNRSLQGRRDRPRQHSL